MIKCQSLSESVTAKLDPKCCLEGGIRFIPFKIVVVVAVVVIVVNNNNNNNNSYILFINYYIINCKFAIVNCKYNKL